MKQGWEIKKLGEVFDLQMGKTPSRDNGDYWGGDNVWVAISDLQDKYIGESKEHITDKALTETKIKKVKAGTTIMSFKLSVGRAAITTQDLYTNEAIMAFNLNEGYDLIADYIYYYLKGYKWQGANKAVMGITLNKASISQNHIAIPSREEQERIVAELDCLSGVIERKREQLRELDALAQSIFYQMFGDPNTNNRNWNVVKLNTTCDNLDYQRRPITAKDRIEGDIPYYGASGVVDYVQDYIFDGDYLLVSEDGANLEVRHTPIAFSIKGKTWVNNHAHILKFEHYCTQLFMEYYINLLDISDIITGCAQPKLTQANLNSIDVFDISIEKQQEFADKIEAIEKQKELIKKSISEVEDLFNSRMSYYFN